MGLEPRFAGKTHVFHGRIEESPFLLVRSPYFACEIPMFDALAQDPEIFEAFLIGAMTSTECGKRWPVFQPQFFVDGYPLVDYIFCYWKWPCIVDLPIQKVIFHSYVTVSQRVASKGGLYYWIFTYGTKRKGTIITDRSEIRVRTVSMVIHLVQEEFPFFPSPNHGRRFVLDGLLWQLPSWNSEHNWNST